MIWVLLILVLGVIIYLYYSHLDNNTKELEREYDLALLYFNQKDYNRAIVILNACIQKNPTHYQLWNNRGEAKYQLGLFDEALIDFKKSIELYPGVNSNPKAYGNIEKVYFTLGKNKRH